MRIEAKVTVVPKKGITNSSEYNKTLLFMETPIVKVENLSHRYNIQWAIRDINFEITRNGVYGLLGSNGAGKSTTMNIMCGVLKPTEGNVYINDISLQDHPIAAKSQIGFLPQQAPLYMDMTVNEYLTHCARMRHIPPKNISEAVRRVMTYCDITHFEKRVIRNLSGGYQQRVGIAQAIVHNPSVVIFDEPTNGLDPNQIIEVRHLIQEIARDKTVILSTHILREVQSICNYIYMIEQGTLVFSGTIEKFYNYIEPNSLIISLISAPPMEELRTIPGVTSVEEIGGTRYRLRFSERQDITTRIAETSVARGWRLNELRLEKSSLDSIFAELSRYKQS